MHTPRSAWRRGVAAVASAALAAAALVGCTADTNAPITVATTVNLPQLDPAAVADPDAVAILHQLYPRLLEIDPDTGDIVPSLAESASFTSDTEYTVVLRPGLTFANGDPLTASDVIFSFERQTAIPNAVTKRLLSGLVSVTAPDAHTIVFTLEAKDPGFPITLAGAAGAILDEEVFAADAVTDTAEIVAGGGFAGDWQVASVKDNVYTLVAGAEDRDAPRSRKLILATGLSGDEVVDRITGGGALAAFGDLTAEQHAEITSVEGVTERSRLGGSIRLLAFDPTTQPFGTATEEKAAGAALAVRQAVAAAIDRDALAVAAGANWLPEEGWVPAGAALAAMDLAETDDGPTRAEQAAAILEEVGITEPVQLAITRPADPSDASGEAIYAELERQLEATGLFEVEIEVLTVSFDRTLLSEKRYPILDVLVEPLASGEAAPLAAVYSSWRGLPIDISDDALDDLIRKLAATAGVDQRAEIVEQIESKLASTLTTIPLLSGQKVLYLGPSVPADVDLPELAWFDKLTA